MNVTEEIAEIRSCIEMSIRLISICSTVIRELKGIHIGDLHHATYSSANHCQIYTIHTNDQHSAVGLTS